MEAGRFMKAENRLPVQDRIFYPHGEFFCDGVSNVCFLHVRV